MAATLSTVRLLIDDVESDLFTDSQINTIISKWNDDYLAAAALLDILSVSAALQAKLTKTGKVTVDRTKLPMHLRAAADRYRELSEEGPAVAIAERNWSPEIAGDIVINDILRDL